MEILGLGVDLVEIERFRTKVSARFLARVFAEDELEYVKLKKDPIPSLAVRFAAKEALIKAFGWTLFGQRLKDIIIVKEDDKPPYIKLRGTAKIKAQTKGAVRILVSLSHTESMAMAEVIVIGGEDR